MTEITYNYPSYPVEGYVTVTYNDNGIRTHDIDDGVPEVLRGYYGTCGPTRTTETVISDEVNLWSASTTIPARCSDTTEIRR